MALEIRRIEQFLLAQLPSFFDQILRDTKKVTACAGRGGIGAGGDSLETARERLLRGVFRILAFLPLEKSHQLRAQLAEGGFGADRIGVENREWIFGRLRRNV